MGLTPQILEKVNAPVPVIRGKIEESLEHSPKSGAMGNSGQVAQVFITPRLKRVIDVANEEASKLKDEYISTEHLLLAIASERNTPSSNILRDQGVTKERLQHAVEEIRGGQRVTEPGGRDQIPHAGKIQPRPDPACHVEGKLDPVIGRDAEILRVIQVLSRRTKNNPVLIGEAGVGKTAIVEGLAQK